MKKHFRKLCSIALLAAVPVMITSGCQSSGGNKAKTADTESGTTQTTYTGKAPITTESGKKLTVLATNAYVSNVDLAKAPVVQNVAKRAGVTVDWQLIAPTSYQDALAPRLAAGADLPDIVYVPNADVNLQYANGGIFVPIDDYYNREGINLKKLYTSEDFSTVKASLTTPDGKMYYVPMLTQTTHYTPCFMVNETWLKKLNIKEPTTLDEFTEMLKKFKTNDPNGNGKQDEIPLAMRSAFLGQAFGPMFGIDLYNQFYVDSSNKVHFAYCDSAYKEYLTYMNSLYKDGLLNQDYLTVTSDSITSKVAQDVLGVTFDYSYNMSMTFNKVAKGNDNNQNAVIKGILPMKGPSGNGGYYLSRSPVISGFGITKSSKDPDLAFRFLDYAIGDECQDHYTWGNEGVTYTTKDGKRTLTDKGKDSTFTHQYGIDPVCVPQIQQSVMVDQSVPAWHYQFDQEVSKYSSDPTFPFVYLTSDESSTLSQYLTDIQTYCTEKDTAFITGKEPISNFETFESNLKSMGIDQVLQAKQEAYDRYLKAVKK